MDLNEKLSKMLVVIVQISKWIASVEMFKTCFNRSISYTTWSCVSIGIRWVINIAKRMLFGLRTHNIIIWKRQCFNFFKRKIKKYDKQNNGENINSWKKSTKNINSICNQKCRAATSKNTGQCSPYFIRKTQIFVPLYFKHKNIQVLFIIANIASFSQGKLI